MTRAEWLRVLLSTNAANRTDAEAAVGALYRAVGLETPRYFLWFDSPASAVPILKILILPHDPLHGGLPKGDDATIAQLRAMLAQEDLASAVVAMGRPFGKWKNTKIAEAIFPAQYHLHPAGRPRFRPIDDDLARAEMSIFVPTDGVIGHVISQGMLHWSFQLAYPTSDIAADEGTAKNDAPAPVLEAAWKLARSVPLCFCFEHAALLIDRPADIHVNKRMLPHREDGPALVYRDGSRIFAYEGQWMTEAVLQKLTAPKKATRQPNTSRILSAKLPADPEMRLARLREHAGGALPRLDRYMAGEHQKVWAELIELGSAVRVDPQAADALAIAFETMRRVDANVRTVTERLIRMGYRFKTREDRAHVQPAKDAYRNVRRLEKLAGNLPLSLRVFYEVVGEVNWMGDHDLLTPPEHAVAPDPLVIFGVESALAEWGSPDELDELEAITIAPDDLHKCDTSGGSPYEIAVPDARADGELRNERHDLFFIDYLRLCFRWGGFPGWEGASADAPRELEELRAGLLQF